MEFGDRATDSKPEVVAFRAATTLRQGGKVNEFFEKPIMNSPY